MSDVRYQKESGAIIAYVGSNDADPGSLQLAYPHSTLRVVSWIVCYPGLMMNHETTGTDDNHFAGAGGFQLVLMRTAFSEGASSTFASKPLM